MDRVASGPPSFSRLPIGSDAASARAVAERRVSWLATLLQQSGGDPASALRGKGADCGASEDPQDWVRRASANCLARASSALAVAIGDVDAVTVGRPLFRGEDWRLLLYVLVSSRSLREAIERTSAFMRAIDGRCGDVELHQAGELGELRWGAPSDPDSLVSYVAATIGMINLHGLLSWLIGQRIEITEALSAHNPRLLSSVTPDLLPLPLKAADRIALRFPAAYLDYPVVSTLEDSNLRPTLSFLVDIDPRAAPEGLLARARALMFDALQRGEGLLSLVELAEAMDCNWETLRRKLRDAGSSYNQLKDSCRRELGLALLQRSELGVEAISDRLGYCDSDAFRIAVRGWIGVSPTAYRRGLKAG